MKYPFVNPIKSQRYLSSTVWQNEISILKEASQLVDIFLFFNDPKQEFFFIKKGTSCQWLVRKTTTYYYEDVEAHFVRGATAYMPHRVGYQVIRKATAEESVNQLGRGIQTLMIGGMTVSA